MVRDQDKERVRDASDIVRVVGELVALRPHGREYMGLCPFHDDHKPSMYVVPSKQIFHCFSCGAGGDVFSFVQRFHRMEFREAMEYLAERAGLELTRTQPTAQGALTRRDLLAANALARDFFRSVLRHEQHGAPARATVQRRRISPETAAAFQIGAAPDRWDGLLLYARQKAGDVRALREIGLLKARDSGEGEYDLLRNRLIFPIHDSIGRVVAFGGRRLRDEDEPKYLNSPESAVFDKSATLFGLSHAARSIQRERTAIVCEGYTDVIACHQAGFTNSVATLGTALTARHAAVLRRMCDRVVLLFDSDEAGERAADRAAQVFFTEPLDVLVATLASVSDAKDPDELLHREGGPDAFSQALTAANDLLEFRIRLVRDRMRGGGLAAQQRALTEELARLAELGLARAEPIRRQLVVRRLAEITGIDPSIIVRAIPAGRPARVDAPSEPGTEAYTARARLSPEEFMLGCATCDDTLIRRASEDPLPLIDSDSLPHAALRPILAAIRTLAMADEPWDLMTLLDAVDEGPAHAALVAIHERVTEETQGDRDRTHALFHACASQLRRKADASRLAVGDALNRLLAQRELMVRHGADPTRLPRPPAHNPADRT